jgi:propionate catabolism operon transcriptional regulator
MGRKIGIIANNPELKKTIEKLYADNVKSGEIIIETLDEDKIGEQGMMLEKKGVKAIIARSGGYFHTVGKVSVPVIQLKISTLDILYAIMTAKKYKKEVVLVLSHMESFDFHEWCELINCGVIIEKFDHHDKIEGIISSYVFTGRDVVIVGGGIPCKVAQNYNLNFVHISASDDSIHDAVARAWEIVDSLYEQKYKNEVLNTTLDGVHDAVLAVDREGKIILYNQRAHELLKKDQYNVLGKSLGDVFPELSTIIDVLKTRTNRYNQIMQLKKVVVTANISMLEIENQAIGVICSFQDITKLQNLEKKIRYEMNKKGLVAKFKFSDIIAADSDMKETMAKAVKIGMSDSTAIIYGESGTGKEMMAQSMHNISDRKDEPFVAINCAALTESLLESELFGYEEGSFTGARKGGKPGLFELAHGGTIFLDEINSVSLNLQSKLLRVLEEKEVMRIGSDYVIPLDVRILTAANESLKDKIKDGSFRRDLFYRLNILELHIPPLRQRKKDILPLFKHYLDEFAEDGQVAEISSEFEEKLILYSWPGNVRELKNIAKRCVIFGEFDLGGGTTTDCKGDNEVSEVENIKEEIEFIEENAETATGKSNIILDLKEIDRYVEKKVITMLEEQGMSKNDIAKMLGISRSSLWNKISSGKDMSKK